MWKQSADYGAMGRGTSCERWQTCCQKSSAFLKPASMLLFYDVYIRTVIMSQKYQVLHT